MALYLNFASLSATPWPSIHHFDDQKCYQTKIWQILSLEIMYFKAAFKSKNLSIDLTKTFHTFQTGHFYYLYKFAEENTF